MLVLRMLRVRMLLRMLLVLLLLLRVLRVWVRVLRLQRNVERALLRRALEAVRLHAHRLAHRPLRWHTGRARGVRAAVLVLRVLLHGAGPVAHGSLHPGVWRHHPVLAPRPVTTARPISSVPPAGVVLRSAVALSAVASAVVPHRWRHAALMVLVAAREATVALVAPPTAGAAKVATIPVVAAAEPAAIVPTRPLAPPRGAASVSLIARRPARVVSGVVWAPSSGGTEARRVVPPAQGGAGRSCMVVLLAGSGGRRVHFQWRFLAPAWPRDPLPVFYRSAAFCDPPPVLFSAAGLDWITNAIPSASVPGVGPRAGGRLLRPVTAAVRAAVRLPDRGVGIGARGAVSGAGQGAKPAGQLAQAAGGRLCKALPRAAGLGRQVLPA